MRKPSGIVPKEGVFTWVLYTDVRVFGDIGGPVEKMTTTRKMLRIRGWRNGDKKGIPASVSTRSPERLAVVLDAGTRESYFCFCGDGAAMRTGVVEYERGSGQTIGISGEGEDTKGM